MRHLTGLTRKEVNALAATKLNWTAKEVKHVVTTLKTTKGGGS